MKTTDHAVGIWDWSPTECRQKGLGPQVARLRQTSLYALLFIVLHRCEVSLGCLFVCFYKLKARSSTSRKITTGITVILGFLVVVGTEPQYLLLGWVHFDPRRKALAHHSPLLRRRSPKGAQ